MIISRSNLVPSATVTSSQGGTPDNVKNHLGGSVWNPTTSNPTLTINLGTSQQIGYVAGVGAMGFTSVTVSVGGGGGSTTFSKTGSFFIYLENPVVASTITLTFVGSGTLLNVACGLAFTVPNGGEQSGYDRIYLQSPIRYVATINNSAVPVSQRRRSLSLEASLVIPNMSLNFAETTWFIFRRFVNDSGFFYIREKDDDSNSSYLCYSPEFSGPSAHASTRQLVTARINFQAYHGG